MYVVWICREKEKKAANDFAGTAQEFNKAYQPYVQKREALLHALSARAQKGTIRRLRRSDYTAIRIAPARAALRGAMEGEDIGV